MGSETANSSQARLGRMSDTVHAFFAVPFRRQTYLNLVYLLLAFPLGLGYFVVFTVMISLGVGLAILLIGIVILGITVGIGLVFAAFERRLTNWLLDTDIPAHMELDGDQWHEKLRDVLTMRQTWTAIVYLPSKFLLGLGSFVLIVTALSTTMSMLLLPLYYDRPGIYVGLVTDRAPEIHQTLYLGWNYLLVGFEAVITVGYWEITTLPQALLVAVCGLLGTILTLHVLNAITTLWAVYTRFMLADSYDVFTIFGE